MKAFKEPMDLAVELWRYKSDPAYRDWVKRFLDLCRQSNLQKAEELLLLCDRFDEPWEVTEFIEKNPPTAGVIAELIKLAMARQKSHAGRNAASKVHSENRAAKADVFAWLDANFSTCTSMDDAAGKMAEKLVPHKFRTVRDWVGQWKKLRSAGTP